MRPVQLFDATGDLYLALVRPDLSSLDFKLSFSSLRRVCSDCDKELALELIEATGWRERLLGFALGALRKEYSVSESVVDSLAHPAGISIVPAGAFLIAQFTTSPRTLPAIDFSRFDREMFDGEVGWTVDRIRMVMSGEALPADEPSPNSGQKMRSHVELFESLFAA